MQDLQITDMGSIEGYWNKLMEASIAWAPRIISAVISALLIYLVGSWLIKLVKRLVTTIFEKRNVELSLRKFLLNLIHWVLNILLFIVVVTQLGVETSSFVAIIGAAGLAIGLALQGSLSNFAGGVLILSLRPFKIGHFIESSTGVSGTVSEIDIFNTKLITPQNQVVVVPNGVLSNSSITNYTALDIRKTWFDIGISYGADLKKAKEILLNVAENNSLALKDPAPQIVVTALGDSAVNLSVRVAATNDVFWTMHEQLIIDCKAALDQAGIEIPFPQRDVHLINPKA